MLCVDTNVCFSSYVIARGRNAVLRRRKRFWLVITFFFERACCYYDLIFTSRSHVIAVKFVASISVLSCMLLCLVLFQIKCLDFLVLGIVQISEYLIEVFAS